MEQFFASLSKRQTMLLLTSLAFGGSEAVDAYAHLPRDEEELLKHRAQAILQIPRDKRIPILVQEIKRLVTWRRRSFGAMEAKRLATVLRDERPATIEIVLNVLPSEISEATRAELGDHQPMKLSREVKPEILAILRWKIEDAMRQGAPQVGGFRFTDLITLQQRDLMAVADRMGARVLATAFAGLAEAERQELLGKLPPDQRALAVRAGEAGAARRLSEKDARLVLEMHGGIENPSLGMRSAGVQRLARACHAQSPDFAQRMGERFPPNSDLGKLMAKWLRDEKGRPVKGDGGRLDIVEQLERLAQKNIIDRPLRLPPPAMRPPPPPPSTGERTGTGQSKALRRPTGGVPRGDRSDEHSEVSRVELSRAESRVERSEVSRSESSRREPPPRDKSLSIPAFQPTAKPSDSQRAQVLRDGKPLDRERRRQTSPVQEIPRRRDAAVKSPVVKGGPGRGSGGGSR